ncbi:MAG TPA: universal stress protein, partial [Kiloniellaceae bacterium]|nr:universal stress protein [Kiloniellaceae bacterium]
HSILVPVRDDGMGDNVLTHAAALARRFSARVRVVHCHPKADDLMPYGVVIPRVLRRQIEEVASRNVDVTKDQLLSGFRTLAESLGLKEQDHTPGTATVRFIEYEGKQVDAVRHFGRVVDLICVPKPDRRQNLGTNTLKAALFSSARPVMMCPHNDALPESFGDHVAIGWNGSLEASRAVALSMAFIEAAKKVSILSSGDTPHAATAAEFQRYLEVRGVAAQVHSFKLRSKNAGQQLLEQCQEIDAGLLVMGAYHDSFERESVLGGNSQAVVDAAAIPVVMTH